MLNTHADIGDYRLINTEGIKVVTGNDRLNVQYKNGQPFDMKPYTKLVFACNWLPPIEDRSRAMHRRIRVLDFKNIFKGEKRDPDMLQKITTKEEFSGLFNIAMVALKQLIKNKEFTGTIPLEQSREQYEQRSDSVGYFARTHLIELEITNRQDAHHEYIEDLYKHYVNFCNIKELKTLGYKSFQTTLRNKIFFIKVKHKQRPALRYIEYINPTIQISRNPDNINSLDFF